MDIKTISWMVLWLAVFSTLIPLVSGLIRFKTRPLYLKLLCLIAVVSLTIDCLSLFPSLRNVGSFYKPLELLLFLGIYYIVLNIQGSRKYFILLAFLNILIAIFVLRGYTGNKTQVYSSIYSALVLIALPVFFFYRLLMSSTGEDLKKIPMFWISLSNLLYSAGNLFLFPIYEYMTGTPSAPDYNALFIYWGFHNLFEILSHVLFTVAFWVKPIATNHSTEMRGSILN